MAMISTVDDDHGPLHSIYRLIRTHPFTCGGVAVWGVTALVVGVLIALHPTDRTVLFAYEHAVAAWWSRLDLYHTGDGFAYLPQFAVLYTPFHALGVPWGSLVWMIVSVAWLGSVHWQLMRCVDPAQSGRYFFFATLLSLPLCVGAIHNGQANTLFAAATVQAVVFLLRSRWSAAAAMLFVAVAFKPLGIVTLLLAPLVYRPLRPRVLLALAIFVAVPFLFGPPGYVARQYLDFIENIAGATVITEHRFANAPGIFRSLGVWIPTGVSTAMSLVGAVAALVAWIVGARVTAGPQRGLLLLAISTSYLMLFNPMNESNSYVILAPVIAAVAIDFLEGGHRPAGWVVVGLVLSMGLLPEPLRRVAPDLSLWGKPLATAVFIGVTVAVMVKPHASQAVGR